MKDDPEIHVRVTRSTSRLKSPQKKVSRKEAPASAQQRPNTQAGPSDQLQSADSTTLAFALNSRSESPSLTETNDVVARTTENVAAVASEPSVERPDDALTSMKNNLEHLAGWSKILRTLNADAAAKMKAGSKTTNDHENAAKSAGDEGPSDSDHNGSASAPVEPPPSPGPQKDLVDDDKAAKDAKSASIMPTNNVTMWQFAMMHWQMQVMQQVQCLAQNMMTKNNPRPPPWATQMPPRGSHGGVEMSPIPAQRSLPVPWGMPVPSLPVPPPADMMQKHLTPGANDRRSVDSGTSPLSHRGGSLPCPISDGQIVFPPPGPHSMSEPPQSVSGRTPTHDQACATLRQGRDGTLGTPASALNMSVESPPGSRSISPFRQTFPSTAGGASPPSVSAVRGHLSPVVLSHAQEPVTTVQQSPHSSRSVSPFQGHVQGQGPSSPFSSAQTLPIVPRQDILAPSALQLGPRSFPEENQVSPNHSYTASSFLAQQIEQSQRAQEKASLQYNEAVAEEARLREQFAHSQGPKVQGWPGVQSTVEFNPNNVSSTSYRDKKRRTAATSCSDSSQMSDYQCHGVPGTIIVPAKTTIVRQRNPKRQKMKTNKEHTDDTVTVHVTMNQEEHGSSKHKSHFVSPKTTSSSSSSPVPEHTAGESTTTQYFGSSPAVAMRAFRSPFQTSAAVEQQVIAVPPAIMSTENAFDGSTGTGSGHTSSQRKLSSPLDHAQGYCGADPADGYDAQMSMSAMMPNSATQPRWMSTLGNFPTSGSGPTASPERSRSTITPTNFAESFSESQFPLGGDSSFSSPSRPMSWNRDSISYDGFGASTPAFGIIDDTDGTWMAANPSNGAINGF